MNWALNYVVEPDYLKVMGIALKSGRFFSAQDNEHAQRVAVVDEALANKFFPGMDPVGKRLHINNGNDGIVEIVGVVGHVKQWSLDADQKESLQAQLYTPFMQLPDKAMAQSCLGNRRSGTLAEFGVSFRLHSPGQYADEQGASGLWGPEHEGNHLELAFRTALFDDAARNICRRRTPAG
jgi:hypothetical protein